MKKKLAILLAGVLTLTAFTACGQKEAAPEENTAAETESPAAPEEPEAAAPAEEETELPSAFESDEATYEDVILAAPVDAYYAYADLDESYDALIIAPGNLTFDNGDGTTAATGGTIYCKGPDGKIMEYGYVEGGGTATPLAAGANYVLFYGGKDYMNKVTLDTAAGEMKTDEGEYFDEYEDAVTLAFLPVATYGNSDEEVEGPSDFVQNQSGVYEFENYDEIIGYLKPGQGYTYLKFGNDGDALIVAEEVKDDLTAEIASVYFMKDGKPVQVGNVMAENMPLRYEDGLIYAGGENTYEVEFLNPGGNGLMVKAYIYRDDSGDKTEYGGFYRETNSFDNDQDFTGGEEEFNALIKEREEKPVIEFAEVES